MGTIQSKKSLWSVGIIAGVVLIVIGVGAGYLDVATRFRFDFISRYFSYFISAMLIGLVLSFVTVIGWVRQFDAGTRLRTAGAVFIAPWAAVLIGYPVDGFDVHGPAALLLYFVVPAAVLLSIVLVIMAGQ